jgi:hypothetical protein
MCSTSATFPVSSTTADSKVIPDVAIVTDDYWLQDATEECFTITRVPSAPTLAPVSAPTPVTNSPTLSNSGSPVQTPSIRTVSPTRTPSTTITMVPSIQTASPMIMPVLLQPVTPREDPQIASSDSNSPIGAIAGGIAGGIVIGLLVIGFIMYRKRSDTVHHSPKPNVIDEQTITRTGTVNGQDPSSSSNTGHPAAAYGGTLSSIESGQLHPTPAPSNTAAVNIPSTAPNLPVAPASLQYEVNYKDQSRTVIGQQAQPMPTVDGLHEQIHIPIAVAMDVSGASGGSNTTRSEPPGRRFEEA